MSSSWEARPACRETGDALCALGLRRWGSWVLTEGPCLQRAPDPAMPRPCQARERGRKGEKAGKEEGRRSGGRKITRNAATQHKSSRAAGGLRATVCAGLAVPPRCPGISPVPRSAPSTMAAPGTVAAWPRAPSWPRSCPGSGRCVSVSPVSDTGAVLGCPRSLGTKGMGCSMVAVGSSECCSLCSRDRVVPVLVTTVAPSPCPLLSQGPRP